MEKSPIVTDSETLQLLDVQIRHNFFPKRLVDELRNKVLVQTHRKERYALVGEKLLSPTDQAAKLIASTFKANELNVAILKRYVFGEPSEAFKVHRDPEEFKGSMFLCSLSGLASLRVFSSEMKIGTEILCPPNTVVVVPSNTPHEISEPYKDYGTCCFLFLGLSLIHI